MVISKHALGSVHVDAVPSRYDLVLVMLRLVRIAQVLSKPYSTISRGTFLAEVYPNIWLLAH